MMGPTITAAFDNRRDAEMTVERLVQEFGIDRSAVFIVAPGSENTVGEIASGADVESGHPGLNPDVRPELEGKVMVSIDTNGDDAIQNARGALEEFGATNLADG
jgi:hypothetical protein